MKIKSMQVGELATNCYFLIDETTNTAAIIDPGDQADDILEAVRVEGVKVEYILLTHGHYDHIGAVAQLHEALPQTKVYLHKADSRGTGFHVVPLADQVADLKYYSDGDTLTLGSLAIHVIHTPGHTPGGVTLQVEDALFTGDTLFQGSCGLGRAFFQQSQNPLPARFGEPGQINRKHGQSPFSSTFSTVSTGSGSTGSGPRSANTTSG